MKVTGGEREKRTTGEVDVFNTEEEALVVIRKGVEECRMVTGQPPSLLYIQIHLTSSYSPADPSSLNEPFPSS